MTKNGAQISLHGEPITATERPIVILLFITFIVTIEIGTFLLLISSATTVKLKCNHIDPPPHHLSTCRLACFLRMSPHLNHSVFRHSTTSYDCVYRPGETYIVDVLNDGAFKLTGNSPIYVKPYSRNRTALIFCTRGVRINAYNNKSNKMADDKGDPPLTASASAGPSLLFYSYKLWRHMFSHHSYPFNGTWQCKSSSFLCWYWRYIMNLHRYLLSLTSSSDLSHFRGFWRYVLSWCDGGLLRVLLFNAVMLAGLLKLGVCPKSLNRARKDHLRLKIVVSYDQRKLNSEPTSKSWRHYGTLLLNPFHLHIRPLRLKWHLGLERACGTSNNCLPKEANYLVDESDGDVSSYLKQFYYGFAGGPRTFRPETAQVRVAPLQCQFLPNPTLNPSIDLAYTGYRIATLGALPASFPVSRSRLAEAGFYFRGEGDEMVCYSCGSHYSGWTSRDDPMTVHRRLAPRCRHVVAKDHEAQGLGGATNSPQSTAPATVEDNRSSVQSSLQLPPLDALTLSSSSSPQWTSQPAIISTGGREATGASLDGHITSSATETPRSTHESTRALMDGHSSGRQSATVTAFQPEGSATMNNTSSRMLVSGTVPDMSTLPSSDEALETPLFPRAGLDLSGAVYPMYQNAASRRRSFDQCRWDDSRAPSLDDVIMSGMFYAGYADCVRCFYCGVGLKHWMPSDDVWKEHVRWRPHCGYLRTVRTEDFIRNIQRQLDTVSSGGIRNSAAPGSALQAASPTRGTPAPTSTTVTTTAATTGSTTEPDSRTHQAASVPQIQSFNASAAEQTSASSSRTSSPASQTMTRQGLASQTQSSSIHLSGALATPGSQATSQASAPIPQTHRPSMPSCSTSGAGMTASSSATASRSPATSAREPATPCGSCAPSQTAGTEGRGNGAVAPAGGRGDPGDAGDGSHGNQRDASSRTASSNAADDLERREHLQEENRRLSQRFRCQLCEQARVNCIFLPCGHVIACETCTQSLASCPQCCAAIRATARVHIP